ncbi:polysaccharide biosynthesis tyrosine autokinase [Emticicia sp. W12TSBA100-4]|uniref:GumC family protein n=1 Tax=Emticicia sp. W12TSBA100-4 TaxID=3160965 RepID=UPI003305FCB8
MNNFELLQEKEDTFDLKLFFLKYLRYWYWFILALFLTLGCAFFYLQYAVPVYDISATILIKDEKKGSSAGNEILKDLDMFSGSKIVENEIEVFKSKVLAEKVIDELNLTVSYYSEGWIRDTELFKKSPVTLNYVSLKEVAYKDPLYIRLVDTQNFELLDENKSVIGKYLYTQALNNSYGRFRVFLNNPKAKNGEVIKIRFIHREEMVERFTKNIKVELINLKSTVLQLGLEDPVPEKGKSILAKLIEVYTFSSLEDKNSEATATLRFIGERLQLITGELKDVEKDVEVYKTSQGITDLSKEGNLFLEKVKENDTKLSEVDIQLKVLDGVERYLYSGQTNVAPATLMVNDPILTSFIEKLGELELQREKVSRTVQPGNPFLETINTQIANTKQAIRENVSNQKRGLIITKNGLQGNNNRFESAIRTIPRKEREFVNIQRQQNIKESLYLLLLQKREETALSYASTVTDSRIVDTPHSTPKPIKPKPMIVFLVALFLGVFIPVAIINVRELLNDSVQSRKDIEHITGMTIFGEIGQKSKEIEGSLVDIKSRSFLSEQFRSLRTNLQYINTNNHGKGTVLVFTSSTSGEGKSFVTLNLAASLASLNKKVAVLELDLRKPKLSAYLNESREFGISNYLVGNTNETDIIKTTSVSNLFLISSGPIPPNPAELLSNGRIETLINVYRETFDYVLIDCPPVGLVTDAMLLFPYADTCFYLVRHEVTKLQNLNILNDLKKSTQIKSLNVILNGVNYKNSHEYRYGYGYGYGYGKGYYIEDFKKLSFIKKLKRNLKKNKISNLFK